MHEEHNEYPSVLIEFSKNAANEFKIEFVEMVKNYKRAANVSRAWGAIG